ncbi:hypothetical protein ACLMJK_000085 [Lecanora helva]
MLINLASICSLLLVLLPFSTALAPTREIYRFPRDVLIENSVFRPSGSLLVTAASVSKLYQLDPSVPSSQPILIHEFTEVTAILGLTETTLDTFYLVATNSSLSQIIPPPGANRIFRVSFHHPNDTDAEIRLVATLPDAGLLNGITTLDANTVLASDSAKGVVHAINVETGTSRIVIKDPLMAPLSNLTSPGLNVGINGLHVQDNYLYFTNTIRGIFARIAVNADGTPAGTPATVIVNGTAFDDFVLRPNGGAFLAAETSNEIVDVGANGGQKVVAGNLNSTEIAEPTSVIFGRGVEKGKLIVTTAGGFGFPVNGNEIVGGQVIEVDLKGSGYRK